MLVLALNAHLEGARLVQLEITKVWPRVGELGRDFECRRQAAYDLERAEQSSERSSFDASKLERLPLSEGKNQRLVAQGRKVANSLERGPDGRLLPRRAFEAI